MSIVHLLSSGLHVYDLTDSYKSLRKQILFTPILEMMKLRLREIT